MLAAAQELAIGASAGYPSVYHLALHSEISVAANGIKEHPLGIRPRSAECVLAGRNAPRASIIDKGAFSLCFP